MRTGWTRWNRLTGTSRYPDESPRVILAVEPIPRVPGRGQGPGGPVRWMVQVLIKDRSHPWGGYLQDAAAGNADDLSAGRSAVELAYRAMDAATRDGLPVVESHMTDREQGTEAPRVNERTEREVQA